MSRIIIAEGASGVEATVWVSLLLAFGTLVWTAYWNRRTERRAYLDEYWFRQVVAPKCISPILALHDDWLSKIDNMPKASWGQSLVQGMIADFQKDMSQLLNSVWIARIFSSDFYSDCCNYLYAVEDSFANEFGHVLVGTQQVSLAKEAMKQSLGDASVRMLSRAASIHGGKLEAGKVSDSSSGKR